jgi:hypothetical protein
MSATCDDFRVTHPMRRRAGRWPRRGDRCGGRGG